MRILFVSTNRLKTVMPPMPLGLASIIAQIDESRHQLQVLDLMFEERPEAASPCAGLPRYTPASSTEGSSS